MSSLFFTPGLAAATNANIKCENPTKIGKIPFESPAHTSLLVPNVVANFSDIDEIINIHILTLIGSKKQNLEFSYFYNFTISDTGDESYKLLVYLEFKGKPSGMPQIEEFDIYKGRIEFHKGALLTADMRQLPFNLINTVQVFIVESDPATSRGTETTVQQGGG